MTQYRPIFKAASRKHCELSSECRVPGGPCTCKCDGCSMKRLDEAVASAAEAEALSKTDKSLCPGCSRPVTMETMNGVTLRSGYDYQCVCGYVYKPPPPTAPANDVINHPAHYTDGQIEVIDYIIDKGWGEGFCLGNAVKYISRAGKKDPSKYCEDLEKGRWYLDRWIKHTQSQSKSKKEGGAP